jgi:ketoreductase RED1
MLAHLGPGMSRRWRDLGDPTLDDETVDSLSNAAEAAYGTNHYAELTEARDRAQAAVLTARELDDTDTPCSGGDH